MLLQENALIERGFNDGQPRIERVLWIDEFKTGAWTIDVSGKKAWPVYQRHEDIETALNIGDARILRKFDRNLVKLLPEDEYLKKHGDRAKKNYALIAPLVEQHIPQIYNRKQRGRMVAGLAEQIGCRKAQINFLLRRYWQDGCVPNATLPNFHRCGQTKDRKDTGKKRGRPCAGGRNLTSEDKDKFRRGIKNFKQTGVVKTLRDAWDRTKEKYFNIGYTELSDGTLVPILPPPDQLPSFHQFKSFYYKEPNRKKEIVATSGEAAYESNNRPILGDETLKAFGPGSLYEIDATVGDIYLRCYLNRNRIIGRPVIYIVVDVFSRLVVGFAVTLEGPSWAGAKLALENAFSDKVTFCKQFGIGITEADWPVQGKCEALLGDNGEIAGYNANALVDPLGIRVVNAPTDRPDLKGIVEGRFPILNRIAIKWVPGAVHATRKRQGKDYRLDATLDLNQFRKLIILCILYYNNSRRLEDYRMSKHMIADEVQPLPREMWNWGMQKLTGKLRPEDPEVLSKNLLPRGTASVTPQGIRFRGVHYVCERALKEQWFERIKGKRTKQVEIVYESLVDHIYIRLERGKRFESCELTPADERFKDVTGTTCSNTSR